jgi:small multidrug resistance pump
MALAIVAEVTGTLELRAVAGGTGRWWPITLVALAYVVSFAFMALALRSLSVGTVYAIWSGVGTAAVAVAGWLLFAERVTWLGVCGMALIVVGVVVLVSSGSGRRDSGSASRPTGGGSPAGRIAGTAAT